MVKVFTVSRLPLTYIFHCPSPPHGFQVRHRLSYCGAVSLKVDFQCFYVHTRVNKIETAHV